MSATLAIQRIVPSLHACKLFTLFAAREGRTIRYGCG
jgi:hypothetical protein